MDNRVFNINGTGSEMLARVLALAIEQEGCVNSGVKSFSRDPQKGLILHWVEVGDLGGEHSIMGKPGSQALAEMVLAELEEDWVQAVPLGRWDKNADHDGHNKEGWHVYVEDWGHIGKYRCVVVAVKPAWMWYGK